MPALVLLAGHCTFITIVSGCRPDKGGSFEVLKLPRGTVPQNCEVLASCRAKLARGRAPRELPGQNRRIRNFLSRLSYLAGPRPQRFGPWLRIRTRGCRPVSGAASTCAQVHWRPSQATSL